MARIPQIVAEQGLDTQRSSMPNIQVDMSQYQAIQNLGATIASIGFKAADRYKAQQDQLAQYKTERMFQEFQNNTYNDLTQYQQDAQPGGENFHAGYMDRFEKQRAQFEAQVPPDLLPQYQVKTENFKGTISNHTAQTEVNLRTDYYKTTLNADVDGLVGTLEKNPAFSDDAWAQVEQNVKMSGLSEQDKAERLQVYRKQINEATVQGFINNGKFEEARGFVDHMGPAPAVVPKKMDKTGQVEVPGGKVIVYGNVDYTRVQPQVKAAISSVSSELGIPLRITSGYRSLQHPVEAAKEAKSPGHTLHRHTTGTAVDLDVAGLSYGDRAKIIKALIARGASGLGVYAGSPNMIHVDWSGLGAGAAHGGVSAWYGHTNVANAPAWFRQSLEEGLADRKAGKVSYHTLPDLNLNQQENNLYLHHQNNLETGKAVQNADGSVSTVRQITVERGGKTYNIPTVWDGKILSNQDAIKRAGQEGWDKWPSYKSDKEAQARYDQMHQVMGKQVETGYVDVTPNKVSDGNWPLQNYERWEFGGPDTQYNTPVAASLDLMTSALGKKLPFRAKEDSIQIRLDNIPEAERPAIIKAARIGGFSGFEFKSDEKHDYVVMRTDTQGIKNRPAWLPETAGKDIISFSRNAGDNSKFVPRGDPNANKLLDAIDKAEHANTVAEEKHQKQVNDLTAKEGWTLYRDNKLNYQWLDDNKDNLDVTDYRMLTNTLKDDEKKLKGTDEKPYERDQTTYVDLMRRALDPKDTEVIRDAIEAQTNNKISKTDFNQIFAAQQKGADGGPGKKADWKKIIRQYVVDKIPKDENGTTDYIDKRMEALSELDDFLTEHPDASRDVVRAKAAEIIKIHAGVANEDKRKTLDMGTYLKAGRYAVDRQALTDAATQLQADRKSGKLDENAYNDQILVLTQWLNLIEEEEKIGK